MSFTKVLFRDIAAQEPSAAAEPAAPQRNFGYNEEAEAVEQEVAPAVEAGEQKPATEQKPAAAEAGASATEVKEAAAAPTQEKETPKFDWKKELKGLERKEVLKELGLDDFEIGMLDYRAKTGDLSPYLEVKTVDYSKLNDEQILKLDMKKQYPGLTEASLNFQFNREQREKYFLDREEYPEDSDEAKFGQERLRLDADKKRKEFIEQQESFKAPEKAPDTAQLQREADEQKRQANLKDAVLNNEATISFTQQKALKFGEGEESFNYPVDNVDDVVSNALNVITNSDRENLDGLSLNDFFKGIAVAANLPAFLDAYGKHHQALGHKKVQDEMQNISPKPIQHEVTAQAEKNHAYQG